MILFGMDLLLAAPIAAFCAIFVYMIVKKEDFGKAFDCGLRSVKKIVLSFLGAHTMVCLGAGMLSSLFLGSIAGTVNVSEWLELLLKGFSDAGSWTIVMMLWVAVFGGIMNAMDAFDPLARAIARISRNTQQLMGWCGVLCMLGNMALADETAQVATMSPIIRNIAEKNIDCSDEDMYRFRLRLATFTSTMGIYGSEIVPWHCFPVFFASIASSVYPVVEFTSKDIIRQNYMSFLVLISILLLTFTGWDRFIPFFALPGKDRAKLKKEH